MAGLGPWETNISVPHMKEPGNVIQTGNALWVDPYIVYDPYLILWSLGEKFGKELRPESLISTFSLQPTKKYYSIKSDLNPSLDEFTSYPKFSFLFGRKPLSGRGTFNPLVD